MSEIAPSRRPWPSLPPPPRPVGTYTAAIRDGAYAWVSGQIPSVEGRPLHPGLVDAEVTVPHAQGAARQAALQALSAIADVTGGLDRIRRVLRVGVYVASSTGFDRQHEVANGATDLLVEAFGDAGRPTRVAVGVARLPLNACVEVELLVAVQD